jgi:rubrerythrin
MGTVVIVTAAIFIGVIFAVQFAKGATEPVMGSATCPRCHKVFNAAYDRCPFCGNAHEVLGTRPAERVCAQCGVHGTWKRVRPGSNAGEVFLWILAILPGLGYTIYRNSRAGIYCPSCGSRDTIPVESPRGAELMRHYRNI